MFLTKRKRILRLAIAGSALLLGMACSGTSCDCVTPLDQPMPDSEKVYDAVQLRMTPQAFGFIENNLTDIISTFLGDQGLVFDVPRMDQEYCAPPFGWPCFSLHICKDGCTLTAEIVTADATPVPPDVIGMDATINLTGTITISGSLDCDVPINMQNKPVHADVRFIVDGRDHLLTFNIEGVGFSLSNGDYSLDCSWWYDWLMDLLQGAITGLINSQISSQLDSAMGGAMAQATCLGCDFYSGGCPSGSSCNSDGYCESDGTCLTNPLGMVGTVDIGSLLASVSPGMQASLDIFAAAGQWEAADVDPVVVNDGIEMRLIGGADAERATCAPTPPADQIPSNAPPPRLPFTDVIPGTADGYMAGIGISDAFLDWFMYKAYLGGVLCMSLDTDATGGMLSSGTLSALLGSLNSLTGGRNTPVRLDLVPGQVPYMEIGAGTFTTDADGNRIMDQPLLYVFMPDMAMDFYVLVNERWVRVVTLSQDITLMLGLDFTPDNKVVPMFDENSILIENVTASNYELLAEDPSVLENLIPTLVGMALPMLGGAIAPIEMPTVQGFALDISAVQGDLPRPNSDFFEYIGMYANLRMANALLPPARETFAKIAQVKTPTLSKMSIWAPKGPEYPSIVLDVSADEGPAAEYSWRMDKGPWSMYQRGPTLTVHDPRLALCTEHTIEVRSRTVGDYLTLDTDPVVLKVNIAPKDDGIEYVPQAGPNTLEKMHDLGIAPSEQSLRSTDDASEAQPHLGCATGSSTVDISLLGLLLMLLAIRRKSPLD